MRQLHRAAPPIQRAERPQQQQQRQQRRSSSTSSLRLAVLAALVWMIRLLLSVTTLTTEVPDVDNGIEQSLLASVDLGNNNNNNNNNKMDGQPHAQRLRLHSPKQSSNTDNNNKRIQQQTSRSIPKDPALFQFQTNLEYQAKQQQEAFCRNWKARLEPQKYPNETHFEPLVPSALEEIGSMFHNDQTFWIEVYPSHDIVSDAVIGTGTWEREKVQRVAQWLQDYAKRQNIPLSNVTFVDIGANVGVYTLNMADLGVNVVAIEPMPSNLQLLRRSFCRNPQLLPRVTLYGIGLTSSTEPNQTCTLYSHNINIGDGTTHCTSDKVPFQLPVDYTVRAVIPMLRLDQVLGQLPRHQHIAVLKVDTEGYEGHVVEGGKQLFQSGRIDHIQSEFNPEWIQKRGSNPRDYLTTFLDAGYRVRRDAIDPQTFQEEAFLTPEQTLNETGVLAGFNDILLEKQQ